jgi:hypothetical protein
MLPSTEREVVQFEIQLDIDPPGRLGPLADIAELLIKRVADGECVTSIDNGRLLIGISDARFVKVDGDRRGGLALLFDITDPTASVAANKHMKTRATRHFERLPDEGRAVSAHMLLRLEPSTYGSNRYRALLETAVGLGRSRVGPHLQRQIKAIFKDHDIKVENADGDLQKAQPAVQMHTVHRDRLRSSMEDVELSEVVLIQPKPPKGAFDPPDIVRVQRHEMRLKVDMPPTMTALQALDRLRPWAKKQGFEQVYVRWKPRAGTAEAIEGPSDLSHNRAKIDLNNKDFGETLFARRHFVTLSGDMTDCVDSLRDDMVGEMAALI